MVDLEIQCRNSINDILQMSKQDNSSINHGLQFIRSMLREIEIPENKFHFFISFTIIRQLNNLIIGNGPLSQ